MLLHITLLNALHSMTPQEFNHYLIKLSKFICTTLKTTTLYFAIQHVTMSVLISVPPTNHQTHSSHHSTTSIMILWDMHLNYHTTLPYMNPNPFTNSNYYIILFLPLMFSKIPSNSHILYYQPPHYQTH